MGVTGWWAEVVPTVGTVELNAPNFSGVGAQTQSGVLAATVQTPNLSAANATMSGALAAGTRAASFSGSGMAAEAGTLAATTQAPDVAGSGSSVNVGALAASARAASFSGAGAQVTGVQYISSTSTVSTSVTMPTHQTGDLLVVIAFRSETTTAITVPAGWTNAGSATGGGQQIKIASKVAASGSEVSGTWTNANVGMLVVVYRNATGPTLSPTTWNSGGGTSSATITYPAYTLNAVNGQSWILRIARHTNATSIAGTTPTGYVGRTNQTSFRAIDSNGPVATDPVAQTQSVTTSGNWGAVTIEIRSV